MKISFHIIPKDRVGAVAPFALRKLWLSRQSDTYFDWSPELLGYIFMWRRFRCVLLNSAWRIIPDKFDSVPHYDPNKIKI